MGRTAPPQLPTIAYATWTAYQSMLSTKSAHFEFLKTLTSKEQLGQTRTLAEVAYLEKLLSEHTTAVKRFRDEIATLTQHDSAARDALLHVIAQSSPDSTSTMH